MRRLASAAPRRTNREIRKPTATPIAPARSGSTTPGSSRWRAANGQADGYQDGTDHECRHTDLAALGDLHESLRVDPRRPDELELVRPARRLHLPKPVEAAQVHGDVLHVRDDDVPGDELDEEPDRRAQQMDVRTRARAVVSVAAQAFEGNQHTPVILIEAAGRASEDDLASSRSISRSRGPRTSISSRNAAIARSSPPRS